METSAPSEVRKPSRNVHGWKDPPPPPLGAGSWCLWSWDVDVEFWCFDMVVCLCRPSQRLLWTHLKDDLQAVSRGWF